MKNRTANISSRIDIAAYVTEFADLMRLLEHNHNQPGYHISSDLHLLEEVALTLSSVELRDAVLHFCWESPLLVQNLCMELARTFTGETRCNALCLFAIASIHTQVAMKALPALDAALATNPGHKLSQLLKTAMAAGNYRGILEACQAGNVRVRAHNQRTSL